MYDMLEPCLCGASLKPSSDVIHGCSGLQKFVNNRSLIGALWAGKDRHPGLEQFLNETHVKMGANQSATKLTTLLATFDSKLDRPDDSIPSGLVPGIRWFFGITTPKVPYTTKRYVRQIGASYVAQALNEQVLTSPKPIEYALALASNRPAGFVGLESGAIRGRAETFFQRAERLRDKKLFSELWSQAVLTNGALSDKDVKRLNRLILEDLFLGEHLDQRSKADLSLTWWDDQVRRTIWVFGSLIAFVIIGWFVDLNATSLHGFYRKKLRDAYVVEGTETEHLRDLNTTEKGGPYHFLCATMNFFDDLPWKTTEFSSAYTFLFSRLFCGSQALEGHKDEGVKRREADLPLEERIHGYAKTGRYCGGDLDIATAAAISGAAFSPAVLRNPLLFYMSMLMNLRLGQWLPNQRHNQEVDWKYGSLLDRVRDIIEEEEEELELSGKWFKSLRVLRTNLSLQSLRIFRRLRRDGEPASYKSVSYHSVKEAVRELTKRSRRVGIFPILWDFILTRWVGLRRPMEWKYCFVTDGGHNDNLGVAPIIFRRSKLMIISDATMDPKYSFDDFMKVFRRYRIRGGMNFYALKGWDDDAPGQKAPLDLTQLRPKSSDDGWDVLGPATPRLLAELRPKSADRFSNKHFLVAKLVYKSDPKNPKDELAATVVFVKSSMTGDEPADLKQYQIDNPQFPHDPTTDQFFTEDQVESYRQLGYHIGLELCETVLDGQKLQAGTDAKQTQVPAGGTASPTNDLWGENWSVAELIEKLKTGYFKTPAPAESAGEKEAASVKAATEEPALPSAAETSGAFEQLIQKILSSPAAKDAESAIQKIVDGKPTVLQWNFLIDTAVTKARSTNNWAEFDHWTGQLEAFSVQLFGMQKDGLLTDDVVEKILEPMRDLCVEYFCISGAPGSTRKQCSELLQKIKVRNKRHVNQVAYVAEHDSNEQARRRAKAILKS